MKNFLSRFEITFSKITRKVNGEIIIPIGIFYVEKMISNSNIDTLDSYIFFFSNNILILTELINIHIYENPLRILRSERSDKAK